MPLWFIPHPRLGHSRTHSSYFGMLWFLHIAFIHCGGEGVPCNRVCVLLHFALLFVRWETLDLLMRRHTTYGVDVAPCRTFHPLHLCWNHMTGFEDPWGDALHVCRYALSLFWPRWCIWKANENKDTHCSVVVTWRGLIVLRFLHLPSIFEVKHFRFLFCT